MWPFTRRKKPVPSVPGYSVPRPSSTRVTVPLTLTDDDDPMDLATKMFLLDELLQLPAEQPRREPPDLPAPLPVNGPSHDTVISPPSHETTHHDYHHDTYTHEQSPSHHNPSPTYDSGSSSPSYDSGSSSSSDSSSSSSSDGGGGW